MSQTPFDVGNLSDPGRSRRLNEDTIGLPDAVPPEMLQQRGWLYVVSDGMGGEAGGKHASQVTVQRMYETYYAGPGTDVPSRLQAAVQAANASVRTDARANPVLSRMGATVTAALVLGDALHVIHVGDSRAYLVRDGVATQITTDHTWVQEQVDNGTLSAQEAVHHPQSHVLTRAIGAKDVVDPSYKLYQLQPGDKVILCSDGLSNMVTEIEMAAFVTQAPGQRAAENLVAEGNRRGGPDNISVIVLGMPTLTGAPPVPPPGSDVAPTQQDLGERAVAISVAGRGVSGRTMTMLAGGVFAALFGLGLIFALNEGVDKPLNAANALATSAALQTMQANAKNAETATAVAKMLAASQTQAAVLQDSELQTATASAVAATRAAEANLTESVASLTTRATPTANVTIASRTPTTPEKPTQPSESSGLAITLLAPEDEVTVTTCNVTFSWVVGIPYIGLDNIRYNLLLCEPDDPACRSPKPATRVDGFTAVFNPGKKESIESLGFSGDVGKYRWYVTADGDPQLPRRSANGEFVWDASGCSEESAETDSTRPPPTKDTGNE